MPWTAPTAYPTGTLITALIYEQEIVDNLDYLYDEVWLRPDPRDHISVGPNNAAETTLATWVISAGTMGANGFLEAQWAAVMFNNSGAPITCTFRLKLGATTLITLDGSNCDTGAGTGTNSYGKIRVGNNDDEAAQYTSGMTVQPDNDIASGSDDFILGSTGWGLSAEDTSGDLNCVLTAQLSAAAASVYVEVSGIALLGPIYLA